MPESAFDPKRTSVRSARKSPHDPKRSSALLQRPPNSRSEIRWGNYCYMPHAQLRSISPSTSWWRSVPSAVSTILTLSLVPLPSNPCLLTMRSSSCYDVTPTCFRYLRSDILKRSFSTGDLRLFKPSRMLPTTRPQPPERFAGRHIIRRLAEAPLLLVGDPRWRAR